MTITQLTGVTMEEKISELDEMVTLSRMQQREIR